MKSIRYRALSICILPALVMGTALAIPAAADPAPAGGAALAKAGDGKKDFPPARSWRPGPLSTPYGDYLAGRHAEGRHDAALASELLSRTLRVLPDDPGLMRQTLHQMIAAGRMERALPLAGRYYKLQPKSVMAPLLLAVEDMRQKRFAAAREKLKAIPPRGLGSYFVPLALAWAEVGDGNTDQALKTLAPLAKRQGFKGIHDLHAALILAHAGDDTRAAALFDAVVAGREHQHFVALAGRFFEHTGDRDRAEKIYRDFLSREPDSLIMEAALARFESEISPPALITGAGDGVAEALWNLAMLLNQDGIREIALMLTRMALHAKPRFALARILLGDILESSERFADAVRVYDRVATDDPLAWRAGLRAAMVLDRMERTDDALERLSAMVKQKADRADALISRGDLLRFKKRYREAIGDYDKALKRVDTAQQGRWTLFYSRGIALERSKQWALAEKDFLKALELKPGQPFVLNYLGYSWVEKKLHLKKALDMIEKAVRARPTDGFIVDSLGWAHYQMGAFPKAVKYLERAVLLRPEDAAINDHLGDAYWRVGRRAEARFQWRRALNFGPEPEQIGTIEKKLDVGLVAEPQKQKAAGAEGTPRGG